MDARAAGAFGVGFAAGSLAVAGLLFWSEALRRMTECGRKPPHPTLRCRPEPRLRARRAAKPIALPQCRSSSSPSRAWTGVPFKIISETPGKAARTTRSTFPRIGVRLFWQRPRATSPSYSKSERGGLTVYQFDDSRTWCYYYAHLDRYAAGLKEGALLRQGDVLGYVGTTGDAPADTPHLHFSVFRLGPEKEWWKGEAVDPLPLIRQGG